ncbi:MAG: hypothetical protein QNI86_10360 [Halieaceae bacterium]|nr:hypothetical protein [Halieaceae bacterium]
MAAIKIFSLLLYSFLGYVAITRPLTLEANLCTGILLALVIAHSIECVVFRKTIVEAPGHPAWHTLNVFLFGIFHMFQMKEAIVEQGERPA